MKVGGFTFIRNAITFDYPVVEAINSILPLCDELVVAVGKSSDDTLSLVSGIADERIKIIETRWDDTLREGGRVLADESNKAKRALSPDCTWCVYIQADELMHEDHLDTIREAMHRYKDEENVDGLLFNYRHFYGSYDYVGVSSRWYRHEIRIIKNRPDIFSYKDAQGFRKGDNRKLNVKKINAYVHHYGWVKDPRAMQLKQESFHKLYHDDQWVEQNVIKASEFDYSGVDALERFTGKHPFVMQDRILRKNWSFDHDVSFNRVPFKDKCKALLEKYLGVELRYKNYIVI